MRNRLSTSLAPAPKFAYLRIYTGTERGLRGELSFSLPSVRNFYVECSKREKEKGGRLLFLNASFLKWNNGYNRWLVYMG